MNELVATKKHDDSGGDVVSFDNEDAVVKYIKPKTREGSGCMFCGLNQEQPFLFKEKSFLYSFDDGTADAIVTPMTFTYTYEFYDGQSLFMD